MKLFLGKLMRFLMMLFIAVLLLLGWLVVISVVTLWATSYGYKDYSMFISFLVGTIFLLLLAWPYSRWVSKLPIGQLGNATSLGLAISVIILYLTFYGIEKLFGIPSESFVLQLTSQSGVALLAVYVTIFVLAPVCEEILFRGMFLNMFKSIRPWTLWIGAFITSVIFSSIHSQYHHASTFVSLFILALILAAARIRSGGLLLPILLHAEASLMAVILE
ncbi:CPBP family intramembrane glutamic endopeptidase [Xenorhabdus bovienii]|uniref:Surface exclusion protien n=1 Tax=Xenorhabdus bovienii TaxID=40576 RepID=A0A0B6XGE4_XENBV|nr:type II CAAX endopeptidase family protein [Xenorhabdus bovienii]CDM92203.1 Surface exclusion protien [Xenorhabdus bovienii]